MARYAVLLKSPELFIPYMAQRIAISQNTKWKMLALESLRIYARAKGYAHLLGEEPPTNLPSEELKNRAVDILTSPRKDFKDDLADLQERSK